MGIINPATGQAFHTQPQAAAPAGGERIRLLACGKCKTIEPLDDYKGPRELAEIYDVVLNIAVERHQDGVERIPHAPAALVDVAKSDWDTPAIRSQIEDRIRQSFDPHAVTGLGAEAYAIRDTFREDAMTCFEKHLRNANCPDYKSESKRLVPDTNAERRDAGMSKAAEYDRDNPALTRYLCEYCPVHSAAVQAERKRIGMYDK